MHPVAALKAAAKTRRARVREQIVYSDDFGDPMTVEAKFTHDGRQLLIRASNSRFEIETRAETGLFFSVGAPNRWGPRQPLGMLPDARTALFGDSNVTRIATRAASRETMLAWIAEPAHVALFDRLRLEAFESMHAAIGGMRIVLRGDRALDESLFGLVVSIAAALETVPPRPEPAEEPFDGPPELAAFLGEFRHLAEGDDMLRSELTERLSETDRAAFVARVEPLFPAINAYLDSLKHPWPSQAPDLSRLAELGSELLVAAVQSRPAVWSMTAEKFAIEIADRLREILPGGIDVSADGKWVWFGESGKRESGVSVEVAELEPALHHRDPLVTAAENVLNHGQDYVVRCIRERWPPCARNDGGIGMASCFARLEGNVLHMGYGPEDAPVLALRPLSI